VSPSVSVVITNHNYRRFVGAAIDSVLAQSYKPLEVIVVDNGSTDGSLELLSSYGDQICSIPQRNLGQSGGRNRGILEASGELIALLDADDTWHPDKLSLQLPLFQREEVGLVYAGVTECGSDLEPRAVLHPRHRGDCRGAFIDFVGEAIVLGGESTAVIRRECFAAIGLFDPSLSISAGWDVFRRIANRYEFDYVDSPLVNYRQHGTNLHLQTDTYYEDLERAYRRLFDDPGWTSFTAKRSAVMSAIGIMRSKDLMRSGRRASAVYGALRAGLRRLVISLQSK
jgi:glycosyltransferase involved in cell wall biosynthesis